MRSASRPVPTTHGEPHWLRLVRAGTIGCAIAVVPNVLFHALLRSELVARFDVTGAPHPLHTASVVVACQLAAVVATVLALALDRLYAPHAAEVFAVISTFALLVSFGAPLTVVGASTTTRVLLSTMHVIAALGIGTPLLWELLNEESELNRPRFTSGGR